MAFKFNIFTGKFDLVDNPDLLQSYTVWVDANRGNDITGALERPDKKFQTIQAAFDKIQAEGVAGQDWVMHIANGVYTQTSVLLYPTKNIDIKIKCASRNGVVINLNNTTVGFRRNTAGGQVTTKMEIHGGTWNHNGTSVMFQNSNWNNYFYEANFNSNGTYIFFKQDTAYVENCTAICATGAVMSGVGNGGNQVGGQRFKGCYLEASADYIDLQVYGSNFIDCQLTSLTNGYNNTNGQGGGTFTDCVMTSQTTWIDQRGSMNITFQGVCKLIMNTGQVAIRHDGGASNSTTQVQYASLNIDTLIISYALGTGNGGTCINSGSGVYLPLLIRGQLISQRPPQGYTRGAVGFRIAAVPTAGNQITMDLSGNFRGIAPITYTTGASGDPLTELTAFKALIDAQIALGPGNPWYEWTKGDTNLVKIETANNPNDALRVYTADSVAGFRITTSSGYTTSTLGEISNGAGCVPANGTYVLGPGEFTLMPDQELWWGQGQSEIERMTVVPRTRAIYTY